MRTELVVKPLSMPNTNGSKVIRAGTMFLPVAGGKGVTGKSTLKANLGVGDLHLFFNQIAPSQSMIHFLLKEVKSLRDIALTLPPPFGFALSM